MPACAEHWVYGVIAGEVVEARGMEFAEGQGMFVATQQSDKIQILVRAEFGLREILGIRGFFQGSGGGRAKRGRGR